MNALGSGNSAFGVPISSLNHALRSDGGQLHVRSLIAKDEWRDGGPLLPLEICERLPRIDPAPARLDEQLVEAFAGRPEFARIVQTIHLQQSPRPHDATRSMVGRVSLLLPQTRLGTVQSATPVSIHGDRYVDLVIALEGAAGPPVAGRVDATECPASLMPGERVIVRFTMGVMVRVAREVE